MTDEDKVIYFLSDYNWCRGTLLSEGPKNYKIQCSQGHIWRVAKEKCAAPNEDVCIVWEQWRGRNGRGAYRVERIRYPNARMLACQVDQQGWGYGRLAETDKPDDLE